MEMFNEAGHHRFQSRIRRVCHACQHVLRNLLFSVIAHDQIPPVKGYYKRLLCKQSWLEPLSAAIAPAWQQNADWPLADDKDAQPDSAVVGEKLDKAEGSINAGQPNI